VDYFRTEEVLNIYIGVENETDFLCELIKRYFQFQFRCFVSFNIMAEPEQLCFCIVTCIREEPFNIQLMQMNYVPKHSLDQWFRISVIYWDRPYWSQLYR